MEIKIPEASEQCWGGAGAQRREELVSFTPLCAAGSAFGSAQPAPRSLRAAAGCSRTAHPGALWRCFIPCLLPGAAGRAGPAAPRPHRRPLGEVGGRRVARSATGPGHWRALLRGSAPKNQPGAGGREERTESCALAERAEPRCCASTAKRGCCLPGVTPLILITPGSAQPCRADLTASGSVSPTS